MTPSERTRSERQRSMLKRGGSTLIGGKEYWKIVRGSDLETKVALAGTSRRASRTKEEKDTGGNYSTVKSAQRLSATLSIRPRGRVQIIDM